MWPRPHQPWESARESSAAAPTSGTRSDRRTGRRVSISGPLQMLGASQRIEYVHNHNPERSQARLGYRISVVDILKAIPAAATNPFALVAYALAILAFLWGGYRVLMVREVVRGIRRGETALGGQYEP